MFALIKRIFVGIFLNIAALVVCEKVFQYYFQDFYFQGDSSKLVLLALVLTLLHLLIKPILRFFSAPLIWITLGLFSVVINLIILKTAGFFFPELVIHSSIVWLGASLIISIFNSFLRWVK